MTTTTDLSKKQLTTILSALDDAPRSPANPDFSQGSLRRRIGGGPWMRVVVLRIRPAGSAGSGGFWTRWSSRYGRDPVCESAQKAARWR
jgi:hypothetical protein